MKFNIIAFSFLIGLIAAAPLSSMASPLGTGNVNNANPPQQDAGVKSATFYAASAAAELAAATAKKAEADARAYTELNKPASNNSQFANFAFGGKTFTDPPNIQTNKAAAKQAMTPPGSVERYKAAAVAYGKVTQDYKTIKANVDIYYGYIKTITAREKTHMANLKEINAYDTQGCANRPPRLSLPQPGTVGVDLFNAWTSTSALKANYPDPENVNKMKNLFKNYLDYLNEVIKQEEAYKTAFKNACGK